MLLEMDEQQLMFKSAVEKFVRHADDGTIRSLNQDADRPNLGRWKELIDLGVISCWTGLVSSDLARMPVSASDLAVVAEALGYGVATEPWLENGIAPVLVAAAARNTEFIDDLLEGKFLVALASTGDSRVSSTGALPCVVQEDGDGTYRLEGKRVLIPGGDCAERFIVPARLGDELAYFVVFADSGGVAVKPVQMADGKLAAMVSFDAVRLDRSSRLLVSQCDLDRALSLLFLCMAATLLGIARRLFDEVVRYCGQREQFGQPIAQFQAVRHRLVDCHVELQLARALIMRVSMVETEDSAAFYEKAWEAKSYVGAMAMRVAQEAVQLHGAIGVTDELIVGHGLKRILLVNRMYQNFSPEVRRRIEERLP